MTSKKLILVTGGTGKQGGAVARNLVKNGFEVKVLTRNPESAKCQELKKLGVECVKGDLNDVETYREYVRTVYGVFSVQTFDKGVKREIDQGKTLANLSHQFGVKHFVYSSVAGADLNTGIPHFESKFEIEEHIKKIGLPYTILRPASLFENFLFPQVKKSILKGKLMQATNRETVLHYVSCEDVGKMAVRAFLDPEDYLQETITLASEELSTQQVADLFSAELNMPVNYKKLPWAVTRFILGKDVYKMFSWLNQGNRLTDVEQLSKFREVENPLGLKEWINHNFGDGTRARA